MIPCQSARDHDIKTRLEYSPFFGRSLLRKESNQYSGAAEIKEPLSLMSNTSIQDLQIHTKIMYSHIGIWQNQAELAMVSSTELPKMNQ